MENKDINTTPTQVSEVKDEKTFTQADLDRIIDQRLKREREKAEAEKAEAERLASLSAEEKVQEQLKALQQQQEEIKKQKLELETTKILSEMGLPVGFSSFLMGSDMDATKQNIAAFNSLFDSAVQSEIKKRIENTNDKPTGVFAPPKEEKSFEQMTFAERSKLAAEDPEKFKKLANGLY